jgi:hypothetical protein
LMQLCRRIFELHQSFLHAFQRHLSKNPIRNKNYLFISNLLKCLLYPNFLTVSDVVFQLAKFVIK